MDRCTLLAVLLFIHIVLLHIPACSGTCPSGSVTERGVGAYLKQEIVKLHNDYRKQIATGTVAGQPKAANMLQMTWDESIAQQAQVLADTCEFKHVKVYDPRFPVGQNLYTSSNTQDKPGANWTRGVQSWFEENTSYQFGKGVYNHYTQVVWATSYKVGCGYVKYRKDNGFQRLYVCHYGPSGNMAGEAPYKVGNGCENLCLSKSDTQIPRPPKLTPRPLKPTAYPPYIMPFTPNPMPFSPYPMPHPPKRMPYRPKPRPGTPKYRPMIQNKQKGQPRYNATKEEAVIAVVLYLLIQQQAELAAQKALAAQQEADYHEDEADSNEDEADYHDAEYYDETEYEDKTIPVGSNPRYAGYSDNNAQNYPHNYANYRRGAYYNGNHDKKHQPTPQPPPPKKYITLRFIRRI